MVKLAGLATIDLANYLNMSILSSEFETVNLSHCPDKKAQATISLAMEKVADGVPLEDLQNNSMSQDASLLRTLGLDRSMSRSRAQNSYSRFENSQQRGKSRSNSRTAAKAGRALDEIGQIFDHPGIPQATNMEDFGDPLTLTSINDGSRFGAYGGNVPSTIISNNRTQIIKARDLLFKDTDEGALEDRSVSKGRSFSNNKSVDKRSKSNVKISLKKKENLPSPPQQVQEPESQRHNVVISSNRIQGGSLSKGVTDRIKHDDRTCYIDPFEAELRNSKPIEPTRTKILALNRQPSINSNSGAELNRTESVQVISPTSKASEVNRNDQSQTPSYLARKQGVIASNKDLPSIFDYDLIGHAKQDQPMFGGSNPQPKIPFEAVPLTSDIRNVRILTKPEHLQNSAVSFAGTQSMARDSHRLVTVQAIGNGGHPGYDGTAVHAEIESLREGLDKEKVEVGRLKEQIRGQLAVNSDLQLENSRIKMVIDEEKSVAESEHRKRQEADIRIKKLSAEIEELRLRNSSSARQHEKELKEQVQIEVLKYKRLEEDYNLLEEALNEENEVNRKLSAQIQEIEKKGADSKYQSKKIQDLEMSLQAKDNQLRNIQNELKIKTELASNTDNKVAELKVVCSRLESELRESKAYVNQLAAEKRSSSQPDPAVQSKIIKDLNSKIDVLSYKCEQANLRIIDLEDVNSDLRESNKMLVDRYNIDR